MHLLKTPALALAFPNWLSNVMFIAIGNGIGAASEMQECLYISLITQAIM